MAESKQKEDGSTGSQQRPKALLSPLGKRTRSGGNLKSNVKTDKTVTVNKSPIQPKKRRGGKIVKDNVPNSIPIESSQQIVNKSPQINNRQPNETVIDPDDNQENITQEAGIQNETQLPVNLNIVIDNNKNKQQENSVKESKETKTPENKRKVTIPSGKDDLSVIEQQRINLAAFLNPIGSDFEYNEESEEKDESPQVSEDDEENFRQSNRPSRAHVRDGASDKKRKRKRRSKSLPRKKPAETETDSSSESESDSEDEYMSKMLKLLKRMKQDSKGKRSKRSKKRREKKEKENRAKRHRSRSKSRSTDRKHKRRRSSRAYSSSTEREVNNSGSEEESKCTPKKGNKPNQDQTKGSENKYKSLSDHTLYAPAIACVGASPEMKQKYVNERIQNATPLINNGDLDKRSDDVANCKSSTDKLIANFINQIRIGGNSSSDGQKTSSKVRSEVHVRDHKKEEKSRAEKAREDAEDLLLQAERYKADLAPEGNDMYQKIKNLIDANNDDEFFHTICHIEPSIREKIKIGGFVELEKLLVRRKGSKPREDHQVEIVSKQGKTSIISSTDKDYRINSIHRWDQAFRVYATIYTKANPTRSSEIWQYIDSIHRANKTFSWDAVAEYDYCFRQLMSEHPQRSWAKIYTPMWNLTLCENPKVQTQTNGYNSQSQSSTKKEIICWRYNKSKCNYGPRCKFEHKCSYCGSYNHPYQHCPRRGSGSSKGRGEDKKKGKKDKRESDH